MVAFQRGDDSAFEHIVLHYGDRVLAFFRRCGADRSSAEDLAQEAFLRIARARDRKDQASNRIVDPGSVAKLITVSGALSEGVITPASTVTIGPTITKGDTTFHDDEPQPGIPELAAPHAADPATIASVSDLRARVRAAVAELPESQRIALVLNRFEGASYEEVAAALDLSIPAVKSLLHRARENLKQRLLPFLREEVLDEL